MFKKVLSSVLVVVLCIPSLALAATPNIATITKDIRTLNTQKRQAIQSLRGEDAALAKYYKEALENAYSNVERFRNSFRYMYSSNTEKTRAMNYFQSELAPQVQNIINEIKNDRLKPSVTDIDKQTIESDILSYQRDILASIKELLDSVDLTKDIRSTGDMSFAFKGKDGTIEAKINSIQAVQSMKTQDTEYNIAGSIKVDIQTKEREDCSFNDKDDYVCTTIPSEKVKFEAQASFNVKKIGNEFFFTLNSFSVAPETGIKGDINKIIQELRSIPKGKTFGVKIPEGMESEKPIVIINKARSIIDLAMSKSFLTPIAKNNNSYLLDINPAFASEIEKIIGEKIGNDDLSTPIRYTNGGIQVREATLYGKITTLELKKTRGKNTLSFTTRDMISSSSTLDFMLQKDAMTLSVNSENFSIISSWLNGNFSFVAKSDSLGMLTGKEGNLSFEITGKLQKGNIDLTAFLNKESIGMFKYTKNGGLETFEMGFNFMENSFNMKGKSNTEYGTFTIARPLNVDYNTSAYPQIQAMQRAMMQKDMNPMLID